MLSTSLHYINQQLDLLNNKNSNTDITLKILLNKVKDLLMLSRDGKLIDKIEQAIYSLELTTYPTWWCSNRSPLHQTLRSNNKKSLYDQTESRKPYQRHYHDLLVKDRPIIMHLHELLMNTQAMRNVAWCFHYPKNSDGNIENKAINTWAHAQNVFSSSQKLPFINDFLRGMTLDNKPGKDKITTAKYLKELISECNYPEIMKADLKEWLLLKGGQEMNRFLDYCLLDQQIKNPLYNGTQDTTIGLANPVLQNWDVGSNHKLYFEYAVNILSLQYGTEAACYLNQDNQLVVQENTDDFFTEPKNNHLPLLHINAKIEIDATINAIELHIKQFSITSMTKDLQIDPLLYKSHNKMVSDIKEEMPTEILAKAWSNFHII